MKSLMKRCLPLAAPATMLLAGLVTTTAARAETFDLQFIAFCEEADCGWESVAALQKRLFMAIEEVNLEYRPIAGVTEGISYRPLKLEVHVDPRLSKLSGPDDESALPGVDNETLIAEIREHIDERPTVVTVVLTPNLSKCWNGIPCLTATPSDSDNAVFCSIDLGIKGRTVAHELGHYWGLEHTFTFEDRGQVHEYQDQPFTITDPDYDGDDSNDKCVGLPPVTDTRADPGALETQDGNHNDKWDKTEPAGGDDNDKLDQVFTGPEDARELVYKVDHEFCVTTSVNATAAVGHHSTYCSVSCKRVEDDLTLSDRPFWPQTQNAMTYYETCRGPYIDAFGHTIEAFTPDQWYRMHTTRTWHPRRTVLVDVCEHAGGDSDHDGWCDGGRQPDLCPGIFDTDGNGDSDGDGRGDGCDPCPKDARATIDSDDDGVGDLCDFDYDNDRCSNRDDEDPYSAWRIVAYQDSPCGPVPVRVHQSKADGELWRCNDPDDDNDGIPDVDDACVENPDPDALWPDCGYPRLDHCPLNLCLGHDCSAISVRVASASGDYRARFDGIDMRDGDVFVRPARGTSLAEGLQALLGTRADAGTRREREPMRLSAVDDATGRELADLGTYVPEDLAVAFAPGRVLRITPGISEQAPLVRVDWAVGLDARDTPDDADGDGFPGFADNCLAEWNPDQRDVDGDLFGDACDGDAEGDGYVDVRDLDLVVACLGTSLARDLGCAADELAGDAGGDEVDPREHEATLADLAFVEHCRVADLDGDDLVGERDLDLVGALFDAPVGPSGLVERR